MQYILTEDEYQGFVGRDKAQGEYIRSMPSKMQLQKECTRIANEWPSFKGWEGKDDPAPWECIRTVKYEHCCDECPVQDICPYEYKEWSK